MTLLRAFWRDSETPAVISRPVVTRTPPFPEPEAASGLVTRLPRGTARLPGRHLPAQPVTRSIAHQMNLARVAAPAAAYALFAVSPRPRAGLMHPDTGRIHLCLPLPAVHYPTLPISKVVIYSHTPLSCQRVNRTYTRCHCPKCGDRSRHGASVRPSPRTASTNPRGSAAVTPQLHA